MVARKFCLFILLALSSVDRIKSQDIEPQPIPTQPRPTKQTTTESPLVEETGTTTQVITITTEAMEETSTISPEMTTNVQAELTTHLEVSTPTMQATPLPSEITEITITQTPEENTETTPMALTTSVQTTSEENKHTTVVPIVTKDVTASTPGIAITGTPSRRPQLVGSGLVCRKILGAPQYYYNYWSSNYITIVRICHLCCSICGVLQYCIDINPLMCGV